MWQISEAQVENKSLEALTSHSFWFPFGLMSCSHFFYSPFIFHGSLSADISEKCENFEKWKFYAYHLFDKKEKEKKHTHPDQWNKLWSSLLCYLLHLVGSGVKLTKMFNDNMSQLGKDCCWQLRAQHWGERVPSWFFHLCAYQLDQWSYLMWTCVSLCYRRAKRHKHTHALLTRKQASVLNRLQDRLLIR